MEKVSPYTTPATAQTNWLFSAAGSRCELFEKYFINCASKLGMDRAAKECKVFKDDLDECNNMDIGTKRFHRMQEERQKKGLPYQDPPPYDTLPYHKFKNVVF